MFEPSREASRHMSPESGVTAGQDARHRSPEGQMDARSVPVSRHPAPPVGPVPGRIRRRSSV